MKTRLVSTMMLITILAITSTALSQECSLCVSTAGGLMTCEDRVQPGEIPAEEFQVSTNDLESVHELVAVAVKDTFAAFAQREEGDPPGALDTLLTGRSRFYWPALTHEMTELYPGALSGSAREAAFAAFQRQIIEASRHVFVRRYPEDGGFSYAISTPGNPLIAYVLRQLHLAGSFKDVDLSKLHDPVGQRRALTSAAPAAFGEDLAQYLVASWLLDLLEKNEDALPIVEIVCQSIGR